MNPVSDRLYFGVAGVPQSCPDDSSLKGLDCLLNTGLEAMELEFVNGLKMSFETASRLQKKAHQHQLRLSAHAPYFINLNTEDPIKRMQSQDLLLKSLRLAAAAGASELVFHAGYYGPKSAEETYETIKNSLSDVISMARAERIPTRLRIETMGKKKQFGSLDEVLNLCRELDGLYPCLDFAHIFSREGRVNSYRDFFQVLSKVEKKLGSRALKTAHIHISGVHYNQTGELRHLNLSESDFRYEEWLQALDDAGVRGTVICESPSLEADALMLKNLYHSLRYKKITSEEQR
ncbi:MAG: TIM barrel protein [Candidatus Saccharicenans sp.]